LAQSLMLKNRMQYTLLSALRQTEPARMIHSRFTS